MNFCRDLEFLFAILVILEALIFEFSQGSMSLDPPWKLMPSYYSKLCSIVWKFEVIKMSTFPFIWTNRFQKFPTPLSLRFLYCLFIWLVNKTEKRLLRTFDFYSIMTNLFEDQGWLLIIPQGELRFKIGYIIVS